MSNEPPFDEDLPDEIATKVLLIYPNFGDCYLWDLNGVGTGVESFGGSEEFASRFERWANRWDQCMNIDTMELDSATLANEHFDELGVALAAELKTLVGNKSKVIYGFILKHGVVEVLPDGGTCDWPPGFSSAANRKWILNEENPTL